MIVHGRIHPSPLVEHPHDRQLLDPRLTLHPDQLVAPRHQPIRRPAPQLIEMIDHVEHAPIKSWGCDTYRRLRTPAASLRTFSSISRPFVPKHRTSACSRVMDAERTQET